MAFRILLPLLLFALTVTPTRVPLKPPSVSIASPNPIPTALKSLESQDHFAYFKNSAFFDPSSCPIANSKAVNFSKATQSAYAKSHYQFCGHLIPGKSYVVLPTTFTEAAFFPSWASTIIWIVVAPVISFMVFIDHGFEREKVTEIMWITALYTTGQMIYWWYEVGTGFHDPHHAPWLNPSAFGGMFPVILTISIRFSYAFASIVAIIPFSQLVVTFYMIFIRFTPHHVGAIAYALLPTFPVQSLSLTEECYALLTNPISDIYIDHFYDSHRVIQLVQFLFTVTSGLYYSFSDSDVGLNYLRFNFLVAFVCLVWTLVGTCVLAVEGTPFTWNDTCGVVVIGLSSKLSYWDVRSQYRDFMLARRIVRGVFAL